MMEIADISATLRAIPLFGEVLDDAQIERLASKCHVAVFPTGSLLMTEGDFGTSMFAVVEGTLSVTLADKRGAAHGVATLAAGDIVGEMSLMTGARRRATVTATSEVVAIEITKFALEEVLARAPDLIDNFAGILARREAELDRVAADAASSGKDHLVAQIKRFFGGK